MQTKLVWFLIIGLVLGAAVSSVILWQKSQSRSQSTMPSQLLAAPTMQPTPTLSSALVEIIFGGDLMFDRHIRQKSKAAGSYDFILSPIGSLLKNADLVVANLEGPITKNSSISINSVPGGPRNYTFTFDPKVAQTLARFNIKLVNLGNNHILNFGQDGLEQTLDYLGQAKIGWFGYTGSNELKIKNEKLKINPAYVDGVGWVNQRTIKNQTFLFVNFNQFTDQKIKPLLAFIQAKRSQVDWIIVMPHWDNEYQSMPAPITRQRAHQLIEAGADLIVGAHPHVISEVEDYQGKKIYYSLGNFVFDQYFEPSVRKGLLVKVSFRPGHKPQFKEVYIWLKTNGQTRLDTRY